MKNKVIKLLFNKEVAINVRTQEEYDKLIDYFGHLGFLWGGGHKLLEYYGFNYGTSTCLDLKGDNQYECVRCGHTDYYDLDKDFDIIPFTKFEEDYIKKDKTYQAHFLRK